MASAKQTAINQLGNEDDYIGLNALNNERNVAQDTYNTNVNTLQNAYNTLLQNAENRKVEANKDFTEGRNTIASTNYMNNRGITGADLSNRGLSSGFKQLSKYGSVLQNNKSNSNLANTYYNSLEDIKTSIDTGTNEYNTNLETAKNNLNAILADIGTREANARNAYRQQVAALAEQIQARWDANANAAAYNKLLSQQIEEQRKANEAEYNARLAQYYSGLMGDNPTSAKVQEVAKKFMADTGETDMTKALQWLNQYNVYNSNLVNPYYTPNPSKEIKVNVSTKPKSETTSTKPASLISKLLPYILNDNTKLGGK